MSAFARHDGAGIILLRLVVIGFVAGLISGISPCILPLLPVILVAGTTSPKGPRSRIGQLSCPVKAIWTLRPDDRPIYVILDNLNHHKGKELRQWCSDNAVELCFTPTYASWAHPIEAHFGPLREFTINNSDYADHAALAKAIRSYLRWRNANTADPEILDLERKHRAEIRGEAQRRWGQPRRRAAWSAKRANVCGQGTR